MKACKRCFLCRTKRRMRMVQIVILMICIIGSSIFATYYLTHSTKIATKFKDVQNGIEHLLHNKESDFTKEIIKEALNQYNFYHEACAGSDYLRPKTNKCVNKTGIAETQYAALPVFSIISPKHQAIESLPDIKPISDYTGCEIGRIAENLISPLISTYIITRKQKYIKKAAILGTQLLDMMNLPPYPFIGSKTGYFHKSSVFIESVSDIFPILASLAYYTNDESYIKPINQFINGIKKSKKNEKILYSFDKFKGVKTDENDFSFSLLHDLSRVSNILENIDTYDIIKTIIPQLNKGNPLMVANISNVQMYSIESCQLLTMLDTDEGIYKNLAKKCKDSLRNNNIPLRLRGSSEFGDYSLNTNFQFEGEMIEMFWKNGKYDDAKKYIKKVLRECKFDDYITGMRNTTLSTKYSDDILHPRYFSRWVLSSILIDANIPFENCVFSESGFILKYKNEE